LESEKQIFTSLERLFGKIARRAFNVAELEQFRVECMRVVNAIKSIADRSALARCKRIVDAVGVGFTRVGEDIEKIEKRLDALEERTNPFDTSESDE